VVESGLDDMGLDGALGVGEAVRANPNTTKRSKKKKKKKFNNTHSDSLPKIFTKTTQIKTKIKKSSLKFFTVMSLTKRGEIRN
jgi:hypothetical protein